MGGHLALELTVTHLIANVIPAARDYYDSEMTRTKAFAAANDDDSRCRPECDTGKLQAFEVAVAIDGLADRAATGAWCAAAQRHRKMVKNDRARRHAEAVAILGQYRRWPPV